MVVLLVDHLPGPTASHTCIILSTLLSLAHVVKYGYLFVSHIFHLLRAGLEAALADVPLQVFVSFASLENPGPNNAETLF